MPSQLELSFTTISTHHKHKRSTPNACQEPRLAGLHDTLRLIIQSNEVEELIIENIVEEVT